MKIVKVYTVNSVSFSHLIYSLSVSLCYSGAVIFTDLVVYSRTETVPSNLRLAKQSSSSSPYITSNAMIYTGTLVTVVEFRIIGWAGMLVGFGRRRILTELWRGILLETRFLEEEVGG
jgi:hypothetical protein